MNKTQILIMFFSALLISCEKNNIPSEYPTTYNKLPETDLIQRQTKYINRNQYIETSLNDFGFCDINGDLLETETPPYFGEISESEAIDIIRDFISENTSETGVNSPDKLGFYSSSNDTGYNGSILWHFKSENQTIDTIEVMYSMILFHLVNGKVSLCYGNWYPDIYIPSEFIFNQSKAKSVLIGHVVSYYSIGGEESTYTITSNDLENINFHLKILPKVYEDKVELRVCWQIYVPDANYILYVDVITGEIISQEPTIIS
jgi:hypothetical protein